MIMNYTPQKKNNRVLYFGYGMNLDRAHIASLGTNKFIDTAQLDDYKLVYSLFADVVPSKGNKVYGALYEIDMPTSEALDMQENIYTGTYKRVMMTVKGKSGKVYNNVLVYVMTDKTKEQWKDMKPYPYYQGGVIEGAEDLNLPDEYIDRVLGRQERNRLYG